MPTYEQWNETMQFIFFSAATDLQSLKAFDAKRTERARRRLIRR